MSAHPTEAITPRYSLHDRIGLGSMGIVYRAYDRLTGAMVALKRVLLRPDRQAQDDSYKLALAQEFRALTGLRHPNIVSVLDYGFDREGLPFFTMELLHEAQPITRATLGTPLRVRQSYALQLLRALTYLHRRGIVHRDLKPDNVLVTADGVVKVLDFGLALIHGDASAAMQVVGTLAYMAPEVLLGQVATPAADVYSAAMLLYEIIDGTHPFLVSDPIALVEAVLQHVPNVDKLPLLSPQRDILMRCLSKQPHERFAHAGEVIRAYAETMNAPELIETQATRESYLQAARFVGRDAELAVLGQALDEAVQGRGAAYLIGGESGVGKSRLLDEVRALALVRGMTVVRGQSITQGGSLFGLWRPVLRSLALELTLYPEELSVLRELIPDIHELLAIDPLTIPPLNPDVARSRLLPTIAAVISRIQHPTLILLEDLQWTKESLEVLPALATTIGTCPLLILAAYRDDERPDLPQTLPMMRHLHLPRLSREQIEALCEAMLGDEVPRQREVIDLVARETEGNAFFIVEVVRVLAEDAGQLDNIGTRTLPYQVFSGGMRRIVELGLARVDPAAYPLLTVAAVAGRWLDLPLLEHMRPRYAPSLRLDEWLTRCVNAAALSVTDRQWRFSHDKLREGVLMSLDEAALYNLHLQVAEAIEQVYGDDPAQVVRLAHHYHEARNPEREAAYLLRAAEQAWGAGALREAEQFYQRLVALWQTHPPQSSTEALVVARRAAIAVALSTDTH